MPTFQSSPYFQWIFPDEAYRMNKREGMLVVPPGLPLAELGHEVASHSTWGKLARAEALARVSNNKLKEAGMLGHSNTTARSQRKDLPASRSSVPNGVFHGSPMLYAANSGMEGGRIYTKKGQEWLERRLQERRNEYAAISTGQFKSRGTPPSTTPVSPSTDEVDTLLEELFTMLGTGAISSRSSEVASKLLTAFFKVGAGLSEADIADYLRTIEELELTTRTRAGADIGGLYLSRTGEVTRVLKFIHKYMEYCAKLLFELSKVAYEPINVRERLVANQRDVLLRNVQLAAYPELETGPQPELGQSYQPGVPGRRQRRRERVPEPAGPAPGYGDLEEIGRRGEL